MDAFFEDPLKFSGLPSLSSAGLEFLVEEVVEVDMIVSGGDMLLGKEAFKGTGEDCGCCSRFKVWLRTHDNSSMNSSSGRGGVALVGETSSSSSSV